MVGCLLFWGVGLVFEVVVVIMVRDLGVVGLSYGWLLDFLRGGVSV